MHLILFLIFGLIVGAIARFLAPGKESGGWFLSMILGVAGSFAGTFLGRILDSTEKDSLLGFSCPFSARSRSWCSTTRLRSTLDDLKTRASPPQGAATSHAEYQEMTRCERSVTRWSYTFILLATCARSAYASAPGSDEPSRALREGEAVSHISEIVYLTPEVGAQYVGLETLHLTRELFPSQVHNADIGPVVGIGARREVLVRHARPAAFASATFAIGISGRSTPRSPSRPRSVRSSHSSGSAVGTRR